MFPEERDADVFPLRERLRFRDSFGHALLDVRARSAPFRRLAKGPWALFIAIAVHWQSNAEAWPSQAALARFSGWSTRAIRDHTDALEHAGFLRVRRERRGDGAERIFYAPGLVTLAALAAFVDRFPRERGAWLHRPPRDDVAAPVISAALPEATAAAPPEAIAEELTDQDPEEPCSCGLAVAAAPTRATLPATEEQQATIADEDREAARVALSERIRRKHPGRAAPRWFDAGELAMVAACASALDGDRDAKLRGVLDAIAGAFAVSRDGPPTVRFIWGKLDHFLDHVERGRRRRLAVERDARRRSASDGPALAKTNTPIPAPPPAQIAADLDHIFGTSWRTS